MKDELLEKVDKKIREDLQNWENLSEEEQGTTAEMMVRLSFVKNADKFAEDLYNIPKSIVENKCVKCSAIPGKGHCKYCDIVRKVNEHMTVEAENDKLV